MIKKLFLFSILAVLVFTGAKCPETKPAFSYKVYGNIANYFENENDLLTFFNLRKGDVIAEIGAGNGQNLGGLALLSDSLTLYAEDIDSITLSQKQFEKVIRHAEKYKKPLNCTYKRCIGGVKASLLPDRTFDKIFLSAAFHEFTYMDEMISDIKKKLKTKGHLYILESHCFNGRHKNYTAEETITLLARNGFTLIKKDGKDLNNSSGLYRMIFKL